jgi:hypothetical protein
MVLKIGMLVIILKRANKNVTGTAMNIYTVKKIAKVLLAISIIPFIKKQNAKKETTQLIHNKSTFNSIIIFVFFCIGKIFIFLFFVTNTTKKKRFAIKYNVINK